MIISGIHPKNKMFEKSKTEVPKNFFCSLCNVLLLNAFQLPCGHLVCGECRKRLDKENSNACSRRECQKIKYDSKIYEDKCMSRRIQNFVINCKNGCNWRGELLSYQKHLQSCKSTPPQKSEDLEQNFEHLNMQLITGASSDQYTQCEYCSRNDLLQSQIEVHQKYDCPNFKSLCPFTEVGCPERQRLIQKDMDEHKRIGNTIHTDLLLEDYLSLRRTCNDEFERNYNINKKWRTLEDNFKRTTAELVLAIDKYEHRFTDLESRLLKLEEERTMKKDYHGGNLVAELGSRVSDIEAMLSCLQQDGLGSSKQGNLDAKLKNIEAKLENYVTVTQQLEKVCSNQERQLAFKNARIESLEDQISAAEPISCDGSLLWRITDITQKRRDAITRKQAYILSPAFYSGQNGYKMMARLYLHGDGQGKATHISIFFTLLKGPYDALLPWPFKQRVTFAILDQDGVNNCQDSFRPDPMSPSFQRPKTEANISSGCPLFLPLSALDKHAYVKDDCMFVRITVEKLTI